MSKAASKAIFDSIVLGLAAIYIVIYLFVLFPEDPVRHILPDALGDIAFVYLNLVLLIGPVAKLFPRFKKLVLYRRHFGVFTFFFALVHGTIQYVDIFAGKLSLVFGSPSDYTALDTFPFAVLGLLALIIMFLLAITAWDGAVKALTFTRWKLLHMFVYVAFVLAILHVWIGTLQYVTDVTVKVLFLLLISAVVLAHLIGAFKVNATISKRAREREQ